MHAAALRRLWIDLAIVAASIALAIWLMREGTFNQTFVAAQQWGVTGCFFAGIFFTSVFTVGPASVALALLGETLPPLWVATVGAAGALCGDLFIFYFLRGRVSGDLAHAIKGPAYRKVRSFFHLGLVRVLSPVLGALIIASPLPDELGLAMMGLSHTRAIYVVPIAFVMNFLGILALVAAVRVW